MADSKTHSGAEGTWSSATNVESMERASAILVKRGLSVSILDAANGVRPVRPREILPILTDTFTVLGEIYLKYAQANGRMTDAGVAILQKDQGEVQKEIRLNESSEGACLSELLLLMSLEMKQNLASLTGSQAALDSNCLFVIWPFLKKAVIPPGAANSMKLFRDMFSKHQKGPFASFMSEWMPVYHEFVKTFESVGADAHPGYIKASTIGAICLLNSVSQGEDRDFFAFPLAKLLTDLESVHDVDTPEELAGTLHQFCRNSDRPRPASEPALVYAAPVVPAPKKAKPKAKGTDRVCEGCGITFPARLPGFNKCIPCWRLAAAARSQAAATPAKAPRALIAVAQPSSLPEGPSNEWLSALPPHMQQALSELTFMEGGAQFMAQCSLRDEFSDDDSFDESLSASEVRSLGSNFHVPALLGRPPRVCADLPKAGSFRAAPGRGFGRTSPPRVRKRAKVFDISSDTLHEAWMAEEAAIDDAIRSNCCGHSRDIIRDQRENLTKWKAHKAAAAAAGVPVGPMVTFPFPEESAGSEDGHSDDESQSSHSVFSDTELDDVLPVPVRCPPRPICLTLSEHDRTVLRMSHIKTLLQKNTQYQFSAPPLSLRVPIALEQAAEREALSRLASSSSQSGVVPSAADDLHLPALAEVKAFLMNRRRTSNFSDTGATYTCRGNGDKLLKRKPCDIWCGGIGTGVHFTEEGLDPTLPPGLRRCLVAEGCADLISLGYLSSTGRTMFIQDTDCILHVYVDGYLLFSAPKRDNNLYPRDEVVLADKHPAISATNTLSDREYCLSVNCPPPLLTGMPRHKLDALAKLHGATVVYPSASASADKVTISTFYPQVPSARPLHPPRQSEHSASAFKASATSTIYNSEQRKRIDMAEAMQRFLHYPSTDAIATAVSMGAFATASPLDAKDFHNLQAVRGPSPHYLAGFFNKKSMPSSTTPPAPSPGHTLSFDISKLSVPSVNGYTHEIRVVSEYEGYFAVLPAKTGHGRDLFDAMHRHIAATYNASGHRVVTAHADAENVMNSMKSVFGSIGITLTLSPPGQHAQRVERYTQQLNKGARATLDALPYILPPDLLLYLHIAVAQGMTLVPNSASFPLTPHEKVFKRRKVFHASHPFLPFGAVCMVAMGDKKRSTKASAQHYHEQEIAKSEVGVCMGMDHSFPGSFNFYVGSVHKIVPRQVVRVLEEGTIPYGWAPKVSMFRTLKQFPVDLDPSMAPNVPIQPTADPAFALTPDTSSALTPDLLYRHLLRQKAVASAPSLAAAAPPIARGVEVSQAVSPAPNTSSAPATPGVQERHHAVQSPSLSSEAPPVLQSRAQEAFTSVIECQDIPVPASSLRSSSQSPAAVLPSVQLPPPVPSTEPRYPSRANRQSPSVLTYSRPGAQDSTGPRAFLAQAQRSASASGIRDRSERARLLSWGGLERSRNIFGLDPAILPTVAFLSEVSASDIPAGLCMPKKDQHEVSYNKAKKNPGAYPVDQLAASLVKEMAKMTTGMGVLEIVYDAARQIDKDALFVPSMLLCKQKYLANGDKDCISSRFAMIGSAQDPAMFGDTSAATADDATMLCCMSAFQAHAIANDYIKDVEYEAFDVCGAFLHVNLVSPRMIVTRIPSNIDHPLAGKMAIVRKSCYGLRQSNKAFADDFNKTILSAGFLPTTDPCIYKKIVQRKGKHAYRCYVGTHVDDGKAQFNHRPLYDHLIAVLEKRYGTLKKEVLTGFTGTAFTKHSNGAFTRSQEGYINRFLDSVGIVGLRSAKVPSTMELLSDTSLSPPCDQSLYRTLIGSLIHTLKTRYDVQKEVVHLSSKSSCLTTEDLAKVVLVLRYLSGTPKLGPTYYTVQGPRLVCYVDCSYGVHTDGRSHAGFSLHIGDDNAPFFVSSKKQSDCVAVGSMEGEYVALSSSARKILEFRYFMDSIEFEQCEPTVVYEDNKSAINLAQAPAITKNSKHIHIRHHFIRDCVAQNLICLKYLSTDKMLADFLTKPFGPQKHILFRDQLFNTKNIPLS